MKQPLWLTVVGTAAITLMAQAQGTFVFDQQSATVETAPVGGFVNFQSFQPFGQSFTPNLSAIDFVRLFVGNNIPNSESSVYVTLLSGSITGAVMATTATLTIPIGGLAYTNFYFANPVSLVPGNTYYLRPVAATGNPATQIGEFYSNGTEFENGVPQNDDIWFREGIIVPEPSTDALAGIAVAALAWRKSRLLHA